MKDTRYEAKKRKRIDKSSLPEYNPAQPITGENTEGMWVGDPHSQTHKNIHC